MDTLTIKSVPAVISTDYEPFRAYLASEIEKYDIVVTSDTVKEAKALATKLNKVKGEIAAKRKAVVAEVSEPVKLFETQVKALEAMCEDGRQKILSQVAAFEAETLKKAEVALSQFLAERYELHGIKEEFRSARVDDLVKLGALTGTGNLAKAAKESVAARVSECLNKQQRTALRLSKLENQSHFSGLHSPLTREHVAGILFCVDEGEYQANLEALINRELERQKETLAKAEQIRLQEEKAANPEPLPEPPATTTHEPYEFGTAKPVDEILALPAINPTPEQAVLGRLLWAFHEWGGLIESGAVLESGFSTKEHRLIFNQIVSLAEAGDPLDVITVADKLECRGELDAVGGLGYLVQIAENAPKKDATKKPAGVFGNRQVQVSVTLVVEVPRSAPLEAVEAATRKKLVSAGVEKSIQSIFASEMAQQGAA